MRDADKALETAVYIRQLQHKLAAMQRSFAQTVLAIVTAMPDDEHMNLPVIRISQFDYCRAVGRELVTYTDPTNGDQVFMSRPLLPAKDEAAS